MCIAAPGKVIGINGKTATVDYMGEKRKAIIQGIKVKKGDYVLVNTGLVVQKMSEKDALESLKLFKLS
ncbi:MAG: HypC/HybG/HupF family hydrogenase formation chaperone [bacterium]|nr:HypC/HybG/HupF family hydrogenase formation chaperone [bacterium]